MEEENYTILKLIIISLISIIIFTCILFFVAVTRVDAAENSGIYDRSATTSTEVKSSSTNSINIWTGTTGSYSGTLDNWNKVGVYYHTNLTVTNGHTYNYQFTVTVRLQPLLPSYNPCSSWNISAFSIRYPTTLDNMASNQVTVTESNVAKSSCIISGSNENIQTAVYTYTGKFTANRTTNILGARFQIYTSETRYVQSIYSNMILTISETDTTNGDVVGAINNSTSAQIQNDNSNTQNIIGSINEAVGTIIGAGEVIQQPSSSNTDSLHNIESNLLNDGMTSSQVAQNMKVLCNENDTFCNSTDRRGRVSLIENVWNIYLQHAQITNFLIIVMTLCIIKLLLNR